MNTAQEVGTTQATEYEETERNIRLKVRRHMKKLINTFKITWREK
jgi:hypothetical protein